MAYNFTSQWLKEAKNEAADALSRHPHHSPGQGDDLAEYDIDTNDGLMIASQALSIAELRTYILHQMELENLRLQELRQYTKDDPVYHALKEVITIRTCVMVYQTIHIIRKCKKNIYATNPSSW